MVFYRAQLTLIAPNQQSKILQLRRRHPLPRCVVPLQFSPPLRFLSCLGFRSLDTNVILTSQVGIAERARLQI